MDTLEKLSQAWESLRTIPVCDVHVDTMHNVRALLLSVYNDIKAQQEGAKAACRGGAADETA